ncbi:hypothetical protein F5Y00DRAFT_150500 [Daldinia vernicosa]|uniref:uncharacterized protein n=1 Tax=Daldinia vernicosa TaxID=114800 RepID=UPI0020072A1D|nr:uncharacterized protein F5Y00DRAFT_150500 [Daldinia vernicosa]KAI0846034.1 hypothetical protein F5Y00DRAFT_150500 [Daldinia vernicosa]
MKFHDRHFVRLLFLMTAYITYLHSKIPWIAFYLYIQVIDLRSIEYLFSIVVVCCFIYLHGTWALRYLTFTFFSLLSTVRYFRYDMSPVRLR